MLLRTWMITWKEFIQISRDPRLLTVVVVMPILLLLLFGYAINLDVRHVRLAVYDQDHSQASRELSSAFSRSGYFDIVTTIHNAHDVADMLDTGKARMVLVIPTSLSKDLAAGRVVPVQILADGSDSTTASTAVGYAADVVQQHSAQLVLQAVQRGGAATRGALNVVDHRVRYWYNPELTSTNYIVPGLIAIILMAMSALLTSVTIVRERERGTIEPLVASPVMPVELMLGKLIPYAIIAFGDVVLVVICGVLIFHVPLLGNPLLVLLTSGIFVLATLSIGLLISTLAPNQQVATMMAVMGTQLPSVLLSGFIFPINNMPPAIRLLTNIIPATHFIVILRAIFLKGSGFALIWKPLLLLLIIGVILAGLSVARFRKRI